jgi:hypothetical protein
VKLQTHIPERRNTFISVNGTKYKIDTEGVVDVPDSAKGDIKKLLELGQEWSATIRSVSPAANRPVPGAALRNANDFILFLESNTELAERVSHTRSFAIIQNIGFQAGFKFTESEFRKAAQDRVALMKDTTPPVPVSDREDGLVEVQTSSGTTALVSKKAAAAIAHDSELEGADDVDTGEEEEEGVEDDGPPLVQADADAVDDEALKALPAHCFSKKLPKKLPEESSGVWPDPVPQMSMAYLRRVGHAYRISSPGGTSKEELITAIEKAMYPDGK